MIDEVEESPSPAHDGHDAATQREAAVRRRAERLATLFDQRFRIPGTSIRFGYDAIVGLIPVIGDTLSAMVSAYLVVEAYRLELGKATLAKMLGTIAIDWLLGLIPFADVVFDVAYKANTRNLKTLTKALDRRRSGD